MLDLSSAFTNLKEASIKFQETLQATGKDCEDSELILSPQSDYASYFQLDTRLRKLDNSGRSFVSYFMEARVAHGHQ